MPYTPPPRNWARKFANAVRGVRLGAQGQSSFAVHSFATVGVLTAAWWLPVERWEWAMIALCIASVWTAELFNSALEQLARAVDEEYNEHLRSALDIASGAVLLTCCGAAAIGALTLGHAAWRAYGG